MGIGEKGTFKFSCSPLAPSPSSVYSSPCQPMDVISGKHCTDSDVRCSPFLKFHKNIHSQRAIFVFIRSHGRFGGGPKKSLHYKEFQVEQNILVLGSPLSHSSHPELFTVSLILYGSSAFTTSSCLSPLFYLNSHTLLQQHKNYVCAKQFAVSFYVSVGPVNIQTLQVSSVPQAMS